MQKCSDVIISFQRFSRKTFQISTISKMIGFISNLVSVFMLEPCSTNTRTFHQMKASTCSNTSVLVIYLSIRDSEDLKLVGT